jgi:predicted RNase H-like HicB family nuclease
MNVTFTWWKDGAHFLGRLDEYPDFQTQGETFEDLMEHLSDLHHDLKQDFPPRNP